MTDAGFEPTQIATSPLIRCRQTADLILARRGDEAKLVELEALRPGSDLDQLLTWSNKQPDEELAWVGHAPDVGDLTLPL